MKYKELVAEELRSIGTKRAKEIATRILEFDEVSNFYVSMQDGYVRVFNRVDKLYTKLSEYRLNGRLNMNVDIDVRKEDLLKYIRIDALNMCDVLVQQRDARLADMMRRMKIIWIVAILLGLLGIFIREVSFLFTSVLVVLVVCVIEIMRFMLYREMMKSVRFRESWGLSVKDYNMSGLDK